MQLKNRPFISLKYLLLPKNNQWLRRTILVFAFIFFDYLSTLVFCRSPHEEANTYARIFMESFGIPLGLTLFVFMINLPIYIILNLDSHVIKIPSNIATFIEAIVDVVFAWFIAGLHFSGGASWFLQVPSLVCQIAGASLYLFMASLFVKPQS